MSTQSPPENCEPFAVKDCALAAIATGRRAQNLSELRDKLETIDQGSIYYHFWGWRLRPRFEEPEFNNDFAVWVRRDLQDPMLGERLAVIDPTDFPDLESLRRELVEVIDERLDQLEYVPWAKPEKHFYFVRSQIVVFDTHQRISRPEDLPEVLPRLSVSSIFYHFVDARRRTEGGVDDLRRWMAERAEYQELCLRLGELDPYFSSLAELREELVQLCRRYFRVGVLA